jgi:NAD(P)-dependent dehydrogenase (short-subunit alcohol dehydrogenase family)
MKIIIFGSTSYIADQILKTWGSRENSYIFVDRNIRNSTNSATLLKFEENDPDKTFDELKKLLGLWDSSPVLILNFMGTIGSIEPIESMDVAGLLKCMNSNLTPYFHLAKFGRFLPKSSLIISFSGAGIGGSNLDDSSMGYLAAKSAMGISAEAINNQLSKFEVRFGLIAPGAFPSMMQNRVANSKETHIPENRRLGAKATLDDVPNVERLVNLIEFLFSNPEISGGRIWSSNWDELKIPEGDFGKIRRVVND